MPFSTSTFLSSFVKYLQRADEDDLHNYVYLICKIPEVYCMLLQSFIKLLKSKGKSCLFYKIYGFVKSFFIEVRLHILSSSQLLRFIYEWVFIKLKESKKYWTFTSNWHSPATFLPWNNEKLSSSLAARSPSLWSSKNCGVEFKIFFYSKIGRLLNVRAWNWHEIKKFDTPF